MLNLKKNKIPLKNYLILLLIFSLTGILVIYLCNCYTVYNESKKEIPVIRDTLFEITDKELEHYILENPTSLIYMCTASDQSCRNYEEGLIKLVKKSDLKDKMVYLNLSNIDQNEFVEKFNENYHYKVSLTTNYPAIVAFDDGKITSILQEKNQMLTIKKTKQFIEITNPGE